MYGGTSTGKTTGLNALASFLPEADHVVPIEATAELQLHANSATQALARFRSCVLQSGIELPYAAVRHMIADVVQLVLHIDRRNGRRIVTEVRRLRGDEGEHGRCQMEATC
jgi:Flp pilus assembly CpaF family ATPase